ncbi:putative membrane protein [Clostridioides difficile P8]|nr:putative membrane protein [Clostridioides difficile P8]
MDIKLLNQVRSVTKGIVIFDVVLIVLMLITSTLRNQYY